MNLGTHGTCEDETHVMSWVVRVDEDGGGCYILMGTTAITGTSIGGDTRDRLACAGDVEGYEAHAVPTHPGMATRRAPWS
jgi:hypothetical protein